MPRFAIAAVALSCLAVPALALDIPLANGSFDTGSPASNTFGPISNWSVSSVPTSGFASGVFTSYAGFVPTSGSRMALLSNNGSTFVTLRTPTPFALQGNGIFNFSFAFLTTDGVSTALANRDQFLVVIDFFSDAGGVNQIGTQSVTINTGTLASTGVALGAGQPWGSGTVLNGTRTGAASALTSTSILFNLASAPYAHFAFYLDNLGSSGSSQVSGVLIDNAFINPEPGTMALFGLGAAGLAAAAWRRRRNRRLAAK